MAKQSAGILLYRVPGRADSLQVLLVHPGGPYWARKDAGAWSISKGEYEANEEPLAAAKREFAEELGIPAEGTCVPLGEIAQAGGKHVTGFALEGDFDPERFRPGLFEMEWPPKSGRRQSFPEVDRVQWFGLAEARMKINPAQIAFLERLQELLRNG
ncbi:NUDIX domain-containing protein [Methyloligella sp. 2.7D]|uniref:NUDIX domain-containing protein n=1 Tax=unclassified Methyloligella TaxID=2625955 RepID=UPI00157DFE0E|nr:NUDIX domain-containing protein [Methyloligella sp. GL2]QKP76610.1 NUDIX domain-containing protein [Methyloligella sp. GL2]